MSGQLGDTEKMAQPSPASAKLETQAAPATKKAEPTPAAMKSQPTPAPIRAAETVPTTKEKMEPTNATATSAQIELETAIIPTAEKVSPVTTETQPSKASASEPIIPTMTPMQQAVVTQKVEVPNTDVTKTVTVGDKEEAVKKELSVMDFPKTEESQVDLSTVKAEAGVDTASASPVTEAIPTSPFTAKVAVSPVTETQTELAAPEVINKKEQLDDHVKLTEPIKSLQQVEVQPKSQEPQLALELEPVIKTSEVVADKLVEKVIDITATSETQPVSTENVIIKVRMCSLDKNNYCIDTLILKIQICKKKSLRYCGVIFCHCCHP